MDLDVYRRIWTDLDGLGRIWTDMVSVSNSSAKPMFTAPTPSHAGGAVDDDAHLRSALRTSFVIARTWSPVLWDHPSRSEAKCQSSSLATATRKAAPRAVDFAMGRGAKYSLIMVLFFASSLWATLC